MGNAPKRVLFKIIDEMRIYSSLKALLHFSGLSIDPPPEKYAIEKLVFLT